jgi:hypothetical protein
MKLRNGRMKIGEKILVFFMAKALTNQLIELSCDHLCSFVVELGIFLIN